jgi:hypothetical protein
METPFLPSYYGSQNGGLTQLDDIKRFSLGKLVPETLNQRYK